MSTLNMTPMCISPYSLSSSTSWGIQRMQDVLLACENNCCQAHPETQSEPERSCEEHRVISLTQQEFPLHTDSQKL